MKILNISDYESFVDLYEQYKQQKETNDLKSLILLFVASDDPITNQSWCPDCRNSKPIIDKIVEEFQFNQQLVLAIIQVGQKEQWKTDDNPFRSHDLQISAVPTLISLKMVSSSLYISKYLYV